MARNWQQFFHRGTKGSSQIFSCNVTDLKNCSLMNVECLRREKTGEELGRRICYGWQNRESIAGSGLLLSGKHHWRKTARRKTGCTRPAWHFALGAHLWHSCRRSTRLAGACFWTSMTALISYPAVKKATVSGMWLDTKMNNAKKLN